MMSPSRITTLLNKNTSKSKPTITYPPLKLSTALAMMCALLPLLEKVNQVAAHPDTIYATHLATGNDYELQYDTDDFPHFRSAFGRIPQMLIHDNPTTAYRPAVGPHCVSADARSEGGFVHLFVGIGQIMSDLFKQDLNNLMQMQCQDYANTHWHRDPHQSNAGHIIGYVAAAIVGICAIACCCAAITNRRGNDVVIGGGGYYNPAPAPIVPVFIGSDGHHHHHGHHHNDSNINTDTGPSVSWR